MRVIEPVRRGLWGHPDFLRLWAAQAISAFGSRITRTALPIIAVVTLGEPESIVGALVALQLAPGVLLSVVSGGFVDRGRKRRILIAADLIRAAAIVSLTIAWAFGALAVAHVIVVGAIVAAATSLFQIADVAYLPALIGVEHLVEGNSKLATTEAIAEITGPASAGALIAALGAPAAVAIDAATYVWSAVMLGRIRVPDAPAATEPSAGGDLRVGLRAVFGHAQVRPTVLALAVWSIAGGFFSALYPVYCLRTLHLSESAFGVIIALGGIGALGGALISRRLATALGTGPALIITAAISLASLLFIPLARGTSPLDLASLGAQQLLGDAFAVAFIIQAVSLRQTVLPQAVLGRANAAILACTTAVLAVTALAAGWLAETIGVREAVWVGVTIGLASPLFLLPLRQLRVLPAAVSAT